MSSILHNRYLLYTVFIIALADFLYLGSIRDMTSVFVFVLVGLLVSFFNKNMIVVLSSGMIVANVLKYGGINQRLVIEGFEEGVDEEEGEGVQEEPVVKEEEDADTPTPTEKAKAKKASKPKEEKETKDTKEEFGQDKHVVYTSVDDMAITNQDKMMLANEKLLERMNKYKPLLDTLQGLTKNMAIMKGIATSASELKQDIAKEEKKDNKE